MGRTLFLGDSHTHGYYAKDDGNIKAWQENNYAEIFSRENDREVIIYSMAGGCNRKYPTWTRAMLDSYDDIDEIIIQGTYWNRFLLGCSRNLDYGFEITPSHFIDYNCPKDNKIHRYTDHRISENYLELSDKVRAENYEEFGGITFDDFNIKSDWKPFVSKYIYTKLWHELLTHLQYKDYCIDMYAISNMAKERGIPVYLWVINDRQDIPPSLDYFGKVDITVAPMSAEKWIMERHGIDIKDRTTDGEHYDFGIHEIIGKEYIPYLKSQKNA